MIIIRSDVCIHSLNSLSLWFVSRFVPDNRKALIPDLDQQGKRYLAANLPVFNFHLNIINDEMCLNFQQSHGRSSSVQVPIRATNKWLGDCRLLQQLLLIFWESREGRPRLGVFC